MSLGFVLTDRDIGRFWRKVERTDVCWLWRGSIMPKTGYGAFSVGGRQGRTLLAHRIAFVLTYGDIAPGLMVCHHCDNPPCVRSDHLFLGTAAANAQDAAQKGRLSSGERHPSRTKPGYLPTGDQHWTRLYPERLARGDKNWTRRHPELVLCGEQQSSSKLTTADVHRIRVLYQQGGTTHQQLAGQFGVAKSLIFRVIHGQVWKHTLNRAIALAESAQ